jgi:hypothetical protein
MQRDSGQSTTVNVMVVLGLAIAGYFAWIYVPVIWNYFGVRNAVRVAANIAYAHRSEDQVRDSFMKSWKELDIQDQTLNGGEIETTPTPLDRNEDVDVDLKKEPPMVTVTVRYTQKVVWPLLKKEKEVHWSYHHTEDLKNITY